MFGSKTSFKMCRPLTAATALRILPWRLLPVQRWRQSHFKKCPKLLYFIFPIYLIPGTIFSTTVLLRVLVVPMWGPVFSWVSDCLRTNKLSRYITHVNSTFHSSIGESSTGVTPCSQVSLTLRRCVFTYIGCSRYDCVIPLILIRISWCSSKSYATIITYKSRSGTIACNCSKLIVVATLF